MFKIVKAEQLSANVYKKVVLAPRVAASCQPGQFIIVRLDETGERIPLTICDYDREAGTVTIVFQPIGVSTSKMVDLKEGDYFLDFVGPLGRPSELVTDDFEEVKKKKVIFIAGGVGTAPVYPQAKWLHDHGVECDIIIGARSKDILIMEEEMSKVGNLYLCTDDGSYGFKGVGTAMLEKLVSEGHHYDLCVAIGPMIMMKFACLTTKKLGIPTIVSMNPIMVDGTGMCGACRLMVGGEVKFACVDGPEFDGHKVDFDLAMKRQQMYKTEEGRALLKLQEGDTHHGSCAFCRTSCPVIEQKSGGARFVDLHREAGRLLPGPAHRLSGIRVRECVGRRRVQSAQAQYRPVVHRFRTAEAEEDPVSVFRPVVLVAAPHVVPCRVAGN